MSMLVDLEGAAATGAATNGVEGPVHAEEGARIKVTFSHFQVGQGRRQLLLPHLLL